MRVGRNVTDHIKWGGADGQFDGGTDKQVTTATLRALDTRQTGTIIAASLASKLICCSDVEAVPRARRHDA